MQSEWWLRRDSLHFVLWARWISLPLAATALLFSHTIRELPSLNLSIRRSLRTETESHYAPLCPHLRRSLSHQHKGGSPSCPEPQIFSWQLFASINTLPPHGHSFYSTNKFWSLKQFLIAWPKTSLRTLVSVRKKRQNFDLHGFLTSFYWSIQCKKLHVSSLNFL